MNTNIEIGIFTGQPHGIFKGCTPSHQSRRRKDSFAVRLYDARIHIPCEAEIIGIDQQNAQMTS